MGSFSSDSLTQALGQGGAEGRGDQKEIRVDLPFVSKAML